MNHEMALGEDGEAGRFEGQDRTRLPELRSIATRIFREKGYEATTIKDIADELGILKGSIYHYIDSKEQLLFDIVHEAHVNALKNLEKWHPGNEASPVEKLNAFIRGHLEFQLEHLDLVAVYFHDARSLNPDLHAVIIEERDAYDRYVRNILKEGKASGDFRSDLDVKLTSIAIISMLNSLHRWYQPDLGLTPDDVLATYTSLLFAGIVCDGERRLAETGVTPLGLATDQ